LVLANLWAFSGPFQRLPFDSYRDAWGTHAFGSANRPWPGKDSRFIGHIQGA
jgi:hypothetical protein